MCVGVKQEDLRLCACVCTFVITSKNTLTTVQSDTAVGGVYIQACVSFYVLVDVHEDVFNHF